VKTYVGERAGDGSVRLFVTSGDTRRPLGDEPASTSEALDYGYDGAGPANLARVILTDHFRRSPKWWLYRAFQQQFIAAFDHEESWTISELEIAAWYIAVKIPGDAEQR